LTRWPGGPQVTNATFVGIGERRLGRRPDNSSIFQSASDCCNKCRANPLVPRPAAACLTCRLMSSMLTKHVRRACRTGQLNATRTEETRKE